MRILRVFYTSYPHHSCFIPDLKLISSKDLSSMTPKDILWLAIDHLGPIITFILFCMFQQNSQPQWYSRKKKYQAKFSGIEDLSPTTKIMFHLRFDYEMSSFPGDRRGFQNYFQTTPEKVFPKTERTQHPDLNLLTTSLQLWKCILSLIINLNCQNTSFRVHLKHFSVLYRHTEYTDIQWITHVYSYTSGSSLPSKPWQTDTIYFLCIVYSNIDSEIMHFVYVYS